MVSSMPPAIHWDDVEPLEADLGPIAGRWRDLAAPAGAIDVGVNRIEVPPGRMATPLHAEDEEFFFVLAGSGFSHQEDGTFAIGTGDAVFYSAWSPAHTVVAGDEGLDVLAFGTHGPYGGLRFPRLGAVKVMDRVLRGDDTHQWKLEAELGPIELPAQPDPRPSTILNVADVEAVHLQRGRTNGRGRYIGRAVNARRSGFNHVELLPGGEGAPPHVHSAEEEIFVVVAGDGVVVLGDDEHPVRAGSVVSRPAGTGVAHSFRGGDAGLTILMYGTRDHNDLTY
jgi:uncharacterized cupin superfamily protein